MLLQVNLNYVNKIKVIIFKRLHDKPKRKQKILGSHYWIPRNLLLKKRGRGDTI